MSKLLYGDYKAICNGEKHDDEFKKIGNKKSGESPRRVTTGGSLM